MSATKRTSPYDPREAVAEGWSLDLELTCGDGAAVVVPGLRVDSQPILFTKSATGRAGLSDDLFRLQIDDEHTSTPHAALYVSVSQTRSVVRIRDLESTNGLYMDGTRVADAEVRTGALISFGRRSSLARVRVRSANPTRSGELGDFQPPAGLDGISHARRAALKRLDEACRLSAGTRALLVGAAGTGKTAAARQLLERRGHGPPITISCARGQTLQQALRQESRGVVLEQIEHLDPTEQGELVAVLKGQKIAGLVMTSRLDLGALKRMLDSPSRLITELAHMPVISMPSLHECGADEIKYLAREFERRYVSPREGKRDHLLDDPPALSPATFLALEKLVWRDNLRHLREVIEMALLETGVDGRRVVEVADLYGAYLRDDFCVRPQHYEMNLDDFLAFALRTYLVRAMLRERCNTTHAARVAGRALPGFRKKMKQLGLWDPEQGGRFCIPESLTGLQ